MKRAFYLLTALPALAACSGMSDMILRDSTDPGLPGIPTEINCNPEPNRVLSKTGQVIEVSYPVLHPSCTVDGEVRGAVAVAPSDFWSLFGPPSAAPGPSPTEATDDDRPTPNPGAALILANAAGDDGTPGGDLTAGGPNDEEDLGEAPGEEDHDHSEDDDHGGEEHDHSEDDDHGRTPHDHSEKDDYGDVAHDHSEKDDHGGYAHDHSEKDDY